MNQFYDDLYAVYSLRGVPTLFSLQLSKCHLRMAPLLPVLLQCGHVTLGILFILAAGEYPLSFNRCDLRCMTSLSCFLPKKGLSPPTPDYSQEELKKMINNVNKTGNK